MLTAARFVKLSILPLAISDTTSHAKTAQKLKNLRTVEATFPLARGRGANRSRFIGETIGVEDLVLATIDKYIFWVFYYGLALLWSHGQSVSCWNRAGEFLECIF